MIRGCAVAVFMTCTVLAAPAAQWRLEEHGPDRGTRVVREFPIHTESGAVIDAVHPHHTRAVLGGSEKMPDFLLSVRVRVEAWTGAPPNIYLYGRIGPDGFRGFRIGQHRSDLFAWFGHGKTNPSFPGPSVGFESGKSAAGAEWVRAELFCFRDVFGARVWPDGKTKPRWQVLGRCKGQERGRIAVGVWLSPRTPSKARVRFADVSVRPLAESDLQKEGLARIEASLPALKSEDAPAAVGVFRAPERVGLAGTSCLVAFDEQTGEIVNFVDRRSGIEFVARDPVIATPLFRLTLTRPYRGHRRELTSRDFRTVRVQPASPTSVSLTFADASFAGIMCSATARVADDGAVHLRFSVENRTDWAVAAAVFPVFSNSPALSGDGSGDVLLIPWSGGAILRAPGSQRAVRSVAYPGPAFAQFWAHYCPDAGMYAALQDAAGHCKRFLLDTQPGLYVRMQFEHLFPEIEGAAQQLSYDVVLDTFHGDWRDAADRYRKWAVPSFQLRPLVRRGDVPDFLKEGAGILIAGIQNPEGRRRMFGEHMEKLPDLLDAYRRASGLKHIVFVPYGWENRGTWAGINYFPTRPSDQVWKQVNAELRKRGHRTAFLTSGFWWVVKRQQTSNGPAFDDSAQLAELGRFCVQNPDGTLWHVDNYENTKTFGSWRGYSVKLCHGSAGARRVMRDVFLHVASLGVPLISFDQEIGGGQNAPCYSREHGHPPGWGAWMWEGFRDLCAEILRKGKPVQPELGLFLENVSELAIPWMATYWSRQFGEVDVGVAGGRGVGLFSYLYHEYVTCIGAACVQGQGALGTRPGVLLRVRIMANNLARGLIPGPFLYDVPLEGGDQWRRAVARAWRSYCRPYAAFSRYLILGRTLRPPAVECEKVQTYFWRRSSQGRPLRKGGPPMVRVPVELRSVVAGRFEAPDGTRAAFIVNASDRSRTGTVRLPEDGRYRLCDADGRLLRRVSGTRDEQIQIDLDPFGVAVLVGPGAENDE